MATTSVQSTPRVRMDVAAQRYVSILALRDTGADICVGDFDLLKQTGVSRNFTASHATHTRSERRNHHVCGDPACYSEAQPNFHR